MRGGSYSSAICLSSACRQRARQALSSSSSCLLRALLRCSACIHSCCRRGYYYIALQKAGCLLLPSCRVGRRGTTSIINIIERRCRRPGGVRAAFHQNIHHSPVIIYYAGYYYDGGGTGEHHISHHAPCLLPAETAGCSRGAFFLLLRLLPSSRPRLFPADRPVVGVFLLDCLRLQFRARRSKRAERSMTSSKSCVGDTASAPGGRRIRLRLAARCWRCAVLAGDNGDAKFVLPVHDDADALRAALAEHEASALRFTTTNTQVSSFAFCTSPHDNQSSTF